MSSMIGFLEQVGEDAALRHADEDELKSALERVGAQPVLREALLSRDRYRLQELLECQATICCGLVRPEPDEDEEEEPSKEDEIRFGRIA